MADSSSSRSTPEPLIELAKLVCEKKQTLEYAAGSPAFLQCELFAALLDRIQVYMDSLAMLFTEICPTSNGGNLTVSAAQWSRARDDLDELRYEILAAEKEVAGMLYNFPDQCDAVNRNFAEFSAFGDKVMASWSKLNTVTGTKKDSAQKELNSRKWCKMHNYFVQAQTFLSFTVEEVDALDLLTGHLTLFAFEFPGQPVTDWMAPREAVSCAMTFLKGANEAISAITTELEENAAARQNLEKERTELQENVQSLHKQLEEAGCNARELERELQTANQITSKFESQLGLANQNAQELQSQLEEANQNAALLSGDSQALASLDMVELAELQARLERALRLVGDARVQKEADEKERCKICFEARADTVLAPCGHRVCDGCSTALSSCPMCREHIAMKVKLYDP